MGMLPASCSISARCWGLEPRRAHCAGNRGFRRLAQEGEGGVGDGEDDRHLAAGETGLRVVADPDALLQSSPEAGMARRLEGGSQLQQLLLCHDGAYPFPHAAEGADDENAPGAHRRPNSLSATWRRSRFGAVSGVSGSRTPSSIAPRSARAALIGMGFDSQKSRSISGSRRK